MKKLLLLLLLLQPLIALSKDIELNENNHITLRGEVNNASAAKVISGLHKICSSLRKKDGVKDLVFMDKILKMFSLDRRPVIYLVLDTPGGSLFDGIDIIRFMDALPCAVHSISIEAISMGFQLAQASSYRYIATLGTMMSHRTSLSGIGGQLYGELDSRLNYIKAAIDYLDIRAAERIGITLEAYRAKVQNGWWSFGSSAVKQNLVDDEASISCSNELMNQTDKIEVQTSSGITVANFSRCPLLRNPLSFKFKR